MLVKLIAKKIKLKYNANMGLMFCSIASGSSGNCIMVKSDLATVLVDVGIPAKRVDKSLAVLRQRTEHIAVLLTHEHSDHVSGLAGFRKLHPGTTYACRDTCGNMEKSGCTVPLTPFSGDFYVGDITVSPFALSHDVPCVGYSFICRGKKISVLTDTGIADRRVIQRLSDSDLVMIESNHDEAMLAANQRYSYYLKKRITSDRGHLSNAACAEAAEVLCAGGVKQLILAHLSKENNYPELAYSTVYERLRFVGMKDEEIKIEVARPDGMSGLYEIL